MKFVLAWEQRWNDQEGEVNVSELCRELGVSRECGYKCATAGAHAVAA